jgi:hypothetical protein
MTLINQLKRNLAGCRGIAAAVRVTTTFNPDATRDEMIEAGCALGLNPKTVGKQFSCARQEDAEVEALCAGMTEAEFIEAVIKSSN